MESSLDLVQVECLAVDQQGDIWVGGVFGELNQIHTSSGSIESYSDLTRSISTATDKTITRINPIFPKTWGKSEIIWSTPLNNGFHLVNNDTSVGL